jgi:hypothetical protein
MIQSNAPNTFLFKTLAGTLGYWQITGLSADPPGVNFRYRLVQPATSAGGGASPSGASLAARAELEGRFQAASSITAFTDRDAALAGVATDAARTGDAAIVKQALGSIINFSTRDDAAVESALGLSRSGLQSDALEVARSITEFTKRDHALRELAK